MAGRGMRDSLRIMAKPEFVGQVSLKTVVVDLLTDLLDVGVRKILCLQDFPMQNIYDVTFVSSEVCWNAFERFKVLEESETGKRFTIQPLFMQEEKIITVHLYNPFADVSLIWAFLENYCDDLKGGEKIFNRYDIWSGKYRFRARFKVDKECIGGVRRPPAVFSIGGERGFLFYPGQPRYCRKCLSYGHTNTECGQDEKCRFCGKSGHVARECTESRICDVCKKTGHLAKQCSKYRAAKEWFAGDPRTGGEEARKERREEWQRRQRRSAGGDAGGGTAEGSGGPSGIIPGHSEDKSMPKGEVAKEVGVVVTGQGPGTSSNGEEGVEAEEGKVQGAVVGESKDSGEYPLGGTAGKGEEGNAMEHVVTEDVCFSSQFLGGLSDSDLDSGDLESVSSLECGQRMDESPATSGGVSSAASKRARTDRSWAGVVGGEDGKLSGDRESEEESTSSPVPRRRQRNLPGMSKVEVEKMEL